jgi:hypothetical protein
MASEDLKKLNDLLSNQHYRIDSTKYESKKISESGNYQEKTMFVLKKNNKEMLFESYEHDVSNFSWSLERAINIDGDPDFGHYKDLDEYWNEWAFLFEDDVKKTRNAVQRLIKREFQFSYNPENLLADFLISDNQRLKKFEKLKTDYYEIRAHYVLSSQKFLELQEKMKMNNPLFIQYSVIIDEILMKAFRQDPNFLKDYYKFDKAVKIDLDNLLIQAKEQIDHKNFIFSLLAQTSPIQGDRGIKILLDIYRRISEQIRPFINALRISIEIMDGIERPKSKKGFSENCKIIRANEKYSALIEHLDPDIRNSESHNGTKIDRDNAKVILTDNRSGKQIILKEYTYEEISIVTLKLDKTLFLAILLGFSAHKLVLIDEILHSLEYRVLLLGIDNRV